MTINKSQGQSLTNVGLFLRNPVFSHGQLYVAVSRVTNRRGLKILICDNDGKPCSATTNVVYKGKPPSKTCIVEEIMEAACAVEKKSNHGRCIPLDIVAEILVNLPIQDLLRFSSVSKSWRSLICDPKFMKKRAAAAAGKYRRLLMTANQSVRPLYDSLFVFGDASSCPLSSISHDGVVEDATPIVCPIEGTLVLLASCGELWCVQTINSLYLWNPSIRASKKIPNPSDSNMPNFIYGLGYDSVSDDYKLISLHSTAFPTECKLYSLRTDSWRKIDEIFPFSGKFKFQKGAFVSGALHWMVSGSETIISFDLATEKYRNVAPPHYRIVGEELPLEKLEVTALNGKLCVYGEMFMKPNSICIVCQDNGFPACSRCRNGCRSVVWVMEEYGVEKSWTKIFDLNYGDRNHPPDFALPRINRLFWLLEPNTLMPLYLFDNGEMLFRVAIRRSSSTSSSLFVYKGKEATPWKLISDKNCNYGFVYDEGHLSPATWATS